jgi:hypothetical protein
VVCHALWRERVADLSFAARRELHGPRLGEEGKNSGRQSMRVKGRLNADGDIEGVDKNQAAMGNVSGERETKGQRV